MRDWGYTEPSGRVTAIADLPTRRIWGLLHEVITGQHDIDGARDDVIERLKIELVAREIGAA